MPEAIRLDPFSGSNQDPQSLHKYAYCHGDSVNHVDPMGNTSLIVGFVVSTVTQMWQRAKHTAVVIWQARRAMTIARGVTVAWYGIWNAWTNAVQNPELPTGRMLAFGFVGGIVGGYFAIILRLPGSGAALTALITETLNETVDPSTTTLNDIVDIALDAAVSGLGGWGVGQIPGAADHNVVMSLLQWNIAIYGGEIAKALVHD